MAATRCLGASLLDHAGEVVQQSSCGLRRGLGSINAPASDWRRLRCCFRTTGELEQPCHDQTRVIQAAGYLARWGVGFPSVVAAAQKSENEVENVLAAGGCPHAVAHAGSVKCYLYYGGYNQGCGERTHPSRDRARACSSHHLVRLSSSPHLF